MIRTKPGPLVESRRAALAKLAYAVEHPGGVALLCGPAGTGKTVVLEALASEFDGRAVRRPLAAWVDAPDMPDIVLADDAHMADMEALVRVLDGCRARRPEASLVFAGEGRLLSLVSRDPRLVRAVGLRAVLRPYTDDETRATLDAILFSGRSGRMAPADRGILTRTIHEIAAGIPSTITRLADYAALLADSRADGSILPADIEAIHRRLSLHAA